MTAINLEKLMRELSAGGIKSSGCNVKGIVWDEENKEIQDRSDVAAIIAAHDPKDNDNKTEISAFKGKKLAELESKEKDFFLVAIARRLEMIDQNGVIL